MVTAFQDIGRGILSNSTSDAENHEFVPATKQYELYEAYYEGKAYDVDKRSLRVNRAVHLPKAIQPVHQFVRRAVDWWPGHVYPGIMTEDGLAMGRKPNRISYADGTDERVRLAVQQAFAWASQGFDLSVYVRTGAMLGDVFAEIVSDPERQKVYPRLIHPRHVTDIEWNDTGDVTRYTLKIPLQNSKGHSYEWGKTVTKDTITTLLDGRPHGYDGQPATIPNPWGFVPAIWVQHRNIGGQHGDPCFAGTLTRQDSLNAVASAINGYMMKFIHQYVVVGTDDPKGFMEAVRGSNDSRRASANEYSAAYSAYEQNDDRIPVAAAKQPVSAIRLFENMGLGDATPHIERLITEIEKDFPELTLNEKLLGMSELTGPGAVPLVQDVEHKLDEACTNYDAGIIKLGQMCISMAAQCLRDGIWDRRTLTDQQQKFTAFTPESYDRGELMFSISPRTLVPESMLDRITQAAAIERLQTNEGLRRIGLDEEAAAAQLIQNREAKTFESDLGSLRFNAGLLG